MISRSKRICALFFCLLWLPAGSVQAGMFDGLIFQPSDHVPITPDKFNLKYEVLRLKSASDPLLNAWHTPAEGDLTVLLFSGNAGNIAVMMDRIVTYHIGGFSTLAVDYPGFGSSEGRPSEAGCYEAAEAAWHFLTVEKKIPPEKIVIHGFSLGGGSAAYLAAKYQPKALILDSTFTRLSAVPSARQPNMKSAFEAALGDAFDTKTRLTSIKAPLLILHSREDEVVPFELGRELYQSYQNGPKLLAEGKGRHMDFMDNLAVYIPAIKEISGLER